MGRTRVKVHQSEARTLEESNFAPEVDPSDFGYLSQTTWQRQWVSRYPGAFRTVSEIDPDALVPETQSVELEWKSTWPDIPRRLTRRFHSEFFDVASTPNIVSGGAYLGHITAHKSYQGTIEARPSYVGWITCHPSRSR